jgi:hypothetical protein
VVKRLLATKSTSTPTSKFMASAFKATRSNKSTNLVHQPQVLKGVLFTLFVSFSSECKCILTYPFFVIVAQDASASASENASIAASVQISTEDDCDEELHVKKKKLTSWVWEHFTRYDVEVEQNDGSIVNQKWAKCKKCPHKAKADSSNGTKALVTI